MSDPDIAAVLADLRYAIDVLGPLHWCEQCVAIADARRALAGKDAA